MSHVRLTLSAAAVALAVGVAPVARAQSSTLALGIDTTNFDRSVRPQDDFFRFVNGGWLARTEIPADASSWGAFNQLRENSRTALHSIVEEAARSKAPAGSETRKIGDLYASYMDSAHVESLGITPLRGDLAAIAKLTSSSQLPATFAHFARIRVQGPFSVGVSADQKSSKENIVSISQGGLGLPDREYYLSNDAKMKETRDAYRAYITKLFTLAGQPDAAGAADRIIGLETAIAAKQWDRARNRDRNATYNRMTVAELAAKSPSFDWNAYLKAAGLGAAKNVVVRQPDYISAMDAVIKDTPVATWRDYLTFKLLDSYADELPSAFQQARFDFRGRTLSGQQAQSERWKRGVDEVEGIMGEAVGRLYVERNFKPAAKARMDAMVRNLRQAYAVGIDSLEWMSPATKAQAKAKLAKFTVKIAYPNKWRDYS
jgi:predicted metalloendopeptidase